MQTQPSPCLSSSPSVYTDIDEIKFIQVITNLITNAFKFTHDDCKITVRVEDREEIGTILISVEDNGIGNPQKYHAAIFDKFTKALRLALQRRARRRAGHVYHQIVGWHKGRIWFESQENKGSTFYVEIPGY